MCVPALGILGHPDPAQVVVTGAVAEPAAHLHEGVVHDRVAEEVGDAQALQCQTAGKGKSSHSDDVKALLEVAVVQYTGGPAVDLDDADRCSGIVEMPKNVLPRLAGPAVLILPGVFQIQDFRYRSSFRWIE